MDNFKNEHNNAADGDTRVFERPSAEDAGKDPSAEREAGFFKKAADSVRGFFVKLFSKKGANQPMPSKANKKRNSRAERAARHDENAPQGAFAPRKRPRSTVLAVFFTVIKLVAFAAVLCGFIGLGLVLGIAKAYIDTTPTLDISTLTESDRTSYIYDGNGDMITTFASMEYRDWANIDEIPDTLKNALIAVEDVRFYKHGGLDFKRLFSAVINTLRNTNTHGGSTITQQLIKNKVLSNVQSYKRKIQEAYLAYELESTVSKDKILEAYMNDVYLGDSNYGFKTAAKDYFGKELDELTIRECAMLAGMVQKPNVTNPRANTYKRFYSTGQNKMDITNDRTNVVLKAMYNEGFITRAEYEAALVEHVNILEVSAQKQLYDMAYFVEYGVYDVVTHMLEARDLADTPANRAEIEKELRTGGYHIYLTVKPDIQNTVQQTITEWQNYPKLRNSAASEITDPNSGITNAQPQAASVIIDQHTGYIVAMVGGREEPIQKRQLNRAYQSSMPVGSSIKPLAVYGPALDMGASPATCILNSELAIDGYGGEKGYPKIGSRRWEGLTSIRRGVTSSLNIVAARVLFDIVTPELGAKYLERLGVDPSRINVDGPGLALGTSGITPLEMAAAYACIANGGMYIEPISFTTVVAEDGSIVIDARDYQQTRRVFEESSAFMLTDMMKDVVSSGTGTSAIIPGITVAGKTGTNDDYTSVYFAGFTGYYTASLWIGHDKYSEKLASGSTGGNSAAPLWQAYMSKIHEGLSNRPLIDVSPSDIGLTQATICPVSGKLATEECMHDSNNPPLTDWCAIEKMPTEYCDMHCSVVYCKDSEMPAGQYCPAESRYTKCVVLIPSTSLYARLDDSKLYQYIPNAVRTDLTAEEFISNAEHLECCTVHTDAGGGTDVPIEELIASSNALIATVQHYLDTVQTLTQTARLILEGGIIHLQNAIAQADVELIRQYMTELQQNYNVLSALYPPPTQAFSPSD